VSGRKDLPPPDGADALNAALARRLERDPPAAHADSPAPDRESRAPRRRAPRSAPAGNVDNGRPTARDLAAPARRSVAREALKADVPAELGLIQRLHRYRLDKGVDIRDQVAIAVDEWLTAEGY
jgi:hypothetical protein